jgi:hypothetical protein
MEFDFTRIIDKRIITTEIKFYEKRNHFIFTMRRSRLQARIPKSVTNELAYLLGAILGDGNITVTEKERKRARITIYNQSLIYLEHLNFLIKKIFGIAGPIYKKREKRCYVLSCHNKVIISYIINVLGLSPGKKVFMKVPSCVKTKTLFAHFLSGLLDTDGYYTDRRFGFMLNGTNEGFLQELKNLSVKHFKVKFYGPTTSTLVVGSKKYLRTYMHLAVADVPRLCTFLHLRHERWMGRARIELAISTFPKGVCKGSTPGKCSPGLASYR